MTADDEVTQASRGLLDWRLERNADCMALEDRLSEIFQEWRGPVYRYLMMLLHNPEESEEIAQDASLRLHRQMACGGNVVNPKAWLFRVRT